MQNQINLKDLAKSDQQTLNNTYKDLYTQYPLEQINYLSRKQHLINDIFGHTNVNCIRRGITNYFQRLELLQTMVINQHCTGEIWRDFMDQKMFYSSPDTLPEDKLDELQKFFSDVKKQYGEAFDEEEYDDEEYDDEEYDKDKLYKEFLSDFVQTIDQDLHQTAIDRFIEDYKSIITDYITMDNELIKTRPNLISNANQIKKSKVSIQN